MKLIVKACIHLTCLFAETTYLIRLPLLTSLFLLYFFILFSIELFCIGLRQTFFARCRMCSWLLENFLMQLIIFIYLLIISNLFLWKIDHWCCLIAEALYLNCRQSSIHACGCQLSIIRLVLKSVINKCTSFKINWKS